MNRITIDKTFDHKTKTGKVTYPVGTHDVSDDVLKSAKKAKAITKQVAIDTADVPGLKKKVAKLQKSLKDEKAKVAALQESENTSSIATAATLEAFNAFTGEETADVETLDAMTEVLKAPAGGNNPAQS